MHLVVFAGLVTMFGAAALGLDQGIVPGKVAIRGNITKVTAVGNKDVLGTIRVEGEKDKDTEYDKAVVRVTKKTTVEKLEDKERKAATFKDLMEGARVQATFVGPVAESYPVQATAGSILILPPAAKKE
jgi:hypothetical protein